MDHLPGFWEPARIVSNDKKRDVVYHTDDNSDPAPPHCDWAEIMPDGSHRYMFIEPEQHEGPGCWSAMWRGMAVVIGLALIIWYACFA